MLSVRAADRIVKTATMSVGLLVMLVVLVMPAHAAIFASTLPASRSVQTGELATIFASIASAADSALTNCRVELGTPIDAEFAFQATDPLTNAPVGSANAAVTIAPGGTQSFVLSLTARSDIAVTDVAFDFVCDGVDAAQSVPGLNTLLYSASPAPVADIVALAATAGGLGISEVPEDNAFGFFSVATFNLGAAASVEVRAEPGANSDGVTSVLLCQTDVAGTCLESPQPSPLSTTIDAGAAPTFAVFVNSNSDIAFDPARNRVYLNFVQGGAVRGSTSVAMRGGGESFRLSATRQPTFLSPHARPMAVSGGHVYVTNTAAGTLDVIERSSRAIVARVAVGIEPVAVAVRPDGGEIWVANHVSDTISVVDIDPASASYHQVIATVQDVDPVTLSTRFDEPVGVAFADNTKAYVSLSVSNEIAVVDVASYTVAARLAIRAQDPRAITVRDNRLYVIPFESNNRTQLSGCTAEKIDGDSCTFDAVEHVFRNNNVLSTNYDADIVRNPRLPDRDLFVFDTATDTLIETVDTLGTLLYGLTVDSQGRVFVAQTDARNDANGRAGTLKHGLAEMANRAFLNQITRVDCSDGCGARAFFDLEPVPPQHPAPGTALATPFAITISDDDSTLVATAAGSNRVFTVDAESGAVLGRVSVGAVPRGIALTSTESGAPLEAWVLSVADNTVALVDLANPSTPDVVATVQLEDPTAADLRAGRIAFNSADASTTGTFSCESCHPDGHTDQLIWVLDTPICDVDGCTQIPPRLTMPVRGLRDTAPYHWDGIPGDPFGGNNTATINADAAPNCESGDPESCTRVLVDGSLATTMCEQGNCPDNGSGQAGALEEAERQSLARFILNVPYPPAQKRGFHNELSSQARDGFFEFSFINDAGGQATGAQTCGDCHKMPFLVSTNTPGTGMDAPTWRGAYDRWMILPQGRLNIIDLLVLAGIDNSFPEDQIWELAGASSDIWRMVLEGGTGVPGAFARQVTLNDQTAGEAVTTAILDALETSAAEESVLLQGAGLLLDPGGAAPLAMEYRSGEYHASGGLRFSRSDLVQAAANGDLVVTLTARLGTNADRLPPAVWPVAAIHAQTRNVELAFLDEDLQLRINGRHVHADALVLLNGRRVDATVSCESGTLPDCVGEILIVTLAEAPAEGGLHFLQIQNAGGLVSNDMMIFSEQAVVPARSGNLIQSGGSFAPGQFDNNWNTIEIATSDISDFGGILNINVASVGAQPWHAQISHAVMVNEGRQYTLCFRARAQGARTMTAYVDTNLDSYQNLSNGQFRASLNAGWQQFSHSFVSPQTDLRARVAFDFAQSAINVQIDDIGLYEGDSCGTP